MDGAEGEEHPHRGALIAMHWTVNLLILRRYCLPLRLTLAEEMDVVQRAHDLCIGHSRHYAKAHGFEVSRLMAADKVGALMPPAWIYVPMARLTGEIREYRAQSSAYHAATGKGCSASVTDWIWYRWCRAYLHEVAQTGACIRSERLETEVRQP
jgi:hypothetical protein